MTRFDHRWRLIYPSKKFSHKVVGCDTLTFSITRIEMKANTFLDFNADGLQIREAYALLPSYAPSCTVHQVSVEFVTSVLLVTIGSAWNEILIS